MFSQFEHFESYIPTSPPKTLNDVPNELRIYKDKQINIWYSPVGERPANPKLWILGITPGWNQMRIAYEGAAEAIQQGLDHSQAARLAKPQVAFAGSMRKNLITMTDDLGLNQLLAVSSVANLFGTETLRTGSVLKYPVFKGQNNYNGHTPKPLSHSVLCSMIETVFFKELETVASCLILPLGKAVEDVLAYAVAKGKVDSERILTGFPHPSGANGHRHQQFQQQRNSLKLQIRQWYKKAA